MITNRNTPAVYGPSPRHVARMAPHPREMQEWVEQITVHWPRMQAWLLANCTHPSYYGMFFNRGRGFLRDFVDFKPMQEAKDKPPPDVIEFDSKADLALFMLFHADAVLWVMPASADAI